LRQFAAALLDLLEKLHAKCDHGLIGNGLR
jgi:hypothetical protein